MKSLHEEVKLRLEQSNQKYKGYVDKSKRHHILEIGDEVIDRAKPIWRAYENTCLSGFFAE